MKFLGNGNIGGCKYMYMYMQVDIDVDLLHGYVQGQVQICLEHLRRNLWSTGEWESDGAIGPACHCQATIWDGVS